MTHRTYCLVAGLLFLLVASVQCARIILGWSAVVNGVGVPMWASWIAVLVLAFLSFTGLRLSRKAL